MVFHAQQSSAFSPLTPPKDLDRDIEEALQILDTTTELPPSPTQTKQSANVLETPPVSSPSANNLPTKTPKRVNFATWAPLVHEPPHSTDTTPESKKSSLRPLPSKDKSAIKSILKPYHLLHADSALASATMAGEQAAMDNNNTRSAAGRETLQDCEVRLASETRQVKLEAYMSLVGFIQSWQEEEAFPDLDITTLRSKTPVLLRSIKRDLVITHPNTGKLDMDCVKQAVRLLTELLRLPELTGDFDDGFRTFVIDRAISTIQDPTVVKAILTNYLQMLRFFDFKTRPTSTERIDRLLRALGRVDTRKKGNNAIGLRVGVYSALFGQYPSFLSGKVSSWIIQLFQAMVSDIGEIRRNAIALGMRVSTQNRQNPAFARAVLHSMDRSVELSATKPAVLLTSRFMELLSIEDSGAHQDVARAWSAITVLIGGAGNLFANWRYLKQWLPVIERCHRSKNAQTRDSALLGWNKLVSSVKPDQTTAPHMLKMLREPVMAYLKLLKISEEKEVASAAISWSYCNLLYYAFRPEHVNPGQDFWNLYVNDIVAIMAAVGGDMSKAASRMLTGLFGGYPTEYWKVDRVYKSEPVRPEEIPRVDPKWLRRNLPLVMQSVKHCLHATGDDTTTLDMWSALMVSVAVAGRQEVTASSDSRQAVASIVAILHVLLNSDQVDFSATRPGASFSTCVSLARCAIEKVGTRTFMEEAFFPSSQNRESLDFLTSSIASASQTRENGLLHVCKEITTALSRCDQLADADDGQVFVDFVHFCISHIPDSHEKSAFVQAIVTFIVDLLRCGQSFQHASALSLAFRNFVHDRSEDVAACSLDLQDAVHEFEVACLEEEARQAKDQSQEDGVKTNEDVATREAGDLSSVSLPSQEDAPGDRQLLAIYSDDAMAGEHMQVDSDLITSSPPRIPDVTDVATIQSMQSSSIDTSSSAVHHGIEQDELAATTADRIEKADTPELAEQIASDETTSPSMLASQRKTRMSATFGDPSQYWNNWIRRTPQTEVEVPPRSQPAPNETNSTGSIELDLLVPSPGVSIQPTQPEENTTPMEPGGDQATANPAAEIDDVEKVDEPESALWEPYEVRISQTETSPSKSHPATIASLSHDSEAQSTGPLQQPYLDAFSVSDSFVGTQSQLPRAEDIESSQPAIDDIETSQPQAHEPEVLENVQTSDVTTPSSSPVATTVQVFPQDDEFPDIPWYHEDDSPMLEMIVLQTEEDAKLAQNLARSNRRRAVLHEDVSAEVLETAATKKRKRARSEPDHEVLRELDPNSASSTASRDSQYQHLNKKRKTTMRARRSVSVIVNSQDVAPDSTDDSHPNSQLLAEAATAAAASLAAESQNDTLAFIANDDSGVLASQDADDTFQPMECSNTTTTTTTTAASSSVPRPAEAIVRCHNERDVEEGRVGGENEEETEEEEEQDEDEELAVSPTIFIKRLERLAGDSSRLGKLHWRHRRRIEGLLRELSENIAGVDGERGTAAAAAAA